MYIYFLFLLVIKEKNLPVLAPELKLPCVARMLFQCLEAFESRISVAKQHPAIVLLVVFISRFLRFRWKINMEEQNRGENNSSEKFFERRLTQEIWLCTLPTSSNWSHKILHFAIEMNNIYKKPKKPRLVRRERLSQDLTLTIFKFYGVDRLTPFFVGAWGNDGTPKLQNPKPNTPQYYPLLFILLPLDNGDQEISTIRSSAAEVST